MPKKTLPEKAQKFLEDYNPKKLTMLDEVAIRIYTQLAMIDDESEPLAMARKAYSMGSQFLDARRKLRSNWDAT